MAQFSTGSHSGRTHSRDLRLTNAEIELAKARGGLSFSTRRRGLVVCNQALRFGPISAAQAERLRGQLWPKRHERPPRNPTEKGPLLSVHLDGRGDTTCPHCRQKNRNIQLGERNCANSNCRRRFLVKPVSVTDNYSYRSPLIGLPRSYQPYAFGYQ